MGINKFDDDSQELIDSFNTELVKEEQGLSDVLLDEKVSEIKSFVLDSIDDTDPSELAKQTYKMILTDRRVIMLLIDRLQKEAEINPMLYMFVTQMLTTLAKHHSTMVKMQENIIKQKAVDRILPPPDGMEGIQFSDTELIELQKKCSQLGINPEGFVAKKELGVTKDTDEE